MQKNTDKASFLKSGSIKIAFCSFLLEIIGFAAAAFIILESKNSSENMYSAAGYIIFAVFSFLCAYFIIRFSGFKKILLNVFAAEFTYLSLNYLILAWTAGFSLELKSLLLIPISVFASAVPYFLVKLKKR